MSSPAPLPIVICAMNDEMDKFDFLGVNVEVVHTIQGLEAAKQEIPHLLAGNDPQSAHIDNIGTHNYRPVRAIILGAISGVKDFKAIHELRNSLAGIAPEPVIWIIANSISIRVKRALKQWIEWGELHDISHFVL